MKLSNINKYFLLGAVAVLVGSLLFGTAEAEVIVQHSGDTNPTTEGFVEGKFGVGSPSSGAWNVTGNQVTDYYSHALTTANIAALDAGPGWTMTVTSSNLAGAYSDGAYAVVLLNGERFDLGLRSDGSGDEILNLDYTQGYPGTPDYEIKGLGTGYVKLSLTYSNSTKTADVFVNGKEVISDYAGSYEKGSLIGFGGADGDFTHVELLTGVPETSTWGMMLLGFVGLGYLGYRRTSPKQVSASASP